jgi:hypothetical protein
MIKENEEYLLVAAGGMARTVVIHVIFQYQHQVILLRLVPLIIGSIKEVLPEEAEV